MGYASSSRIPANYLIPNSATTFNNTELGTVTANVVSSYNSSTTSSTVSTADFYSSIWDVLSVSTSSVSTYLSSIAAGEDLSFASSYEQGGYISPFALSGVTNATYVYPKGFGYSYTEEEAYLPPMVYIPAQAPTAATTTTVSYTRRLGWDSWARSIEQLERGKFIDLTFNTGIYGSCIGVGTSSKLGDGIHDFSHALLVDQDGVHAYENGVDKGVITAVQSGESKVRIYWLDDFSVVYTVVTGTTTLLYTSETKYTYPNAYVFGYLYSSDDRITSAEYATGTVHYGSA